MKKLINNILMLLTLVVLFTSCESTDLELQNNPLVLTPDSANPDFILNGMLIDAGNQHFTLSSLTAPVMRQVNQFGLYTNSIGQSSMNTPWNATYKLMANLNLLKEISTNLPHHIGMAKILNALEMVNLVDYLGVATYSEAVSEQYPSPGLDDGEMIYTEVLNLLEEAISNLHETAEYTHNDAYYFGDLIKWEKLANSLIIRMYVQSRKSANYNSVQAAQKINAIVSSGMYINSIDDDFQIQFGTNESNPNTRHPFFTNNYLGAANTYMSNDFLNRLLFDKNIEDPRLKYYIYRQTLDTPTGSFIDDCLNAGYAPSDCYVGSGYWGRLHGDDSGIPNDGAFRSTYGIYPAGGAFDDEQFLSANIAANHLGGAGIHPMITSSLMNFLLAEAVLFIPGVNGDANIFLNQAMQDSFDKVSVFSGIVMNPTNINTYKNEVNTDYANANDEGKLKIIINESYIGMFGNGIEPYNAYRRTGYPNFNFINFQIPGSFPRSVFLPKSELDTNDNPDFEQKLLTDQVFWDTNPAGFID